MAFMSVCIELNLGWKVGSCVAFFPHADWSHLRVTQVQILVRVKDAA